MQANAGTQRHVFHGLNVDWSHLRSWKNKALNRERWAEITLFASTAGVLGYVVWWAANAAGSYTILGLG